MIDQYGRTIEYLRIAVTDRCNLRCVYCMPEEGIEQLPHEQILTFDEIERICRISTELGISKIKLTGGEPLVRKGLPDLLGKIKRISGIEQVTLTTNGILLKNQLDELMRQGLDAVNISIDTLDETCYHTVTRCGELNQALEGLQAALEYPNLRVKLNCVPMNQSEEEYIQMAEYAKEPAGGDAVRGGDGRLQAGAAGLLQIERRGVRRQRAAEHTLTNEIEITAVLEHRTADDHAELLALQIESAHQTVERRSEHVLVGRIGVSAVRACEGDAIAAEYCYASLALITGSSHLCSPSMAGNSRVSFGVSPVHKQYYPLFLLSSKFVP